MQLLDDVKKTFGFSEDQQIANLVGKGKSTISKWRKSGEIPARAEKQLLALLAAKGQAAPSGGDRGYGFEPTEFESDEHRLLWEECRKLSKNRALAKLLEFRTEQEDRDKELTEQR